MFDMMVDECRAEDLHLEQPLYLTKDAESTLNTFLETDPRRRLAARGDTRSILMSPFLKAVNWEAVLQKHVTPPVKPRNFEFLSVDPEAPGDADNLGRNPSIENTHC
jgi:hypothetical protein